MLKTDQPVTIDYAGFGGPGRSHAGQGIPARIIDAGKPQSYVAFEKPSPCAPMWVFNEYITAHKEHD